MKKSIRLLGFAGGFALLTVKASAMGFVDPSGSKKIATIKDNNTINFAGVQGDDSSALQQIIDDNAESGAYIKLTGNSYTISGVGLASNIHIRIKKNAEITLPTTRKSIFNIGQTGPSVENTTIEVDGNSGKFRVILRGGLQNKATAVVCGAVTNFRIKGMLVDDQLTKFTAIRTVPKGNSRPLNGTIENIMHIGAKGGYGMLQTQALGNSIIRNITTEGSLCVRLETGAEGQQLSAGAGVDNLTIRKVKSIGGGRVVTLNAHTQVNGKVTINDVISDNCFISVFVVEGKNGSSDPQVIKNNSFHQRLGKFASNSSIRKVRAIYGNRAQQSPKRVMRFARPPSSDWDYLKPDQGVVPNFTREELEDIIGGPNIVFGICPAACAVFDATNFDVNIPASKIRQVDLPNNHPEQLKGKIIDRRQYVLQRQLNYQEERVRRAKDFKNAGVPMAVRQEILRAFVPRLTTAQVATLENTQLPLPDNFQIPSF